VSARRTLAGTAQALYVLLVAVATVAFIGWATDHDVLLAVALPLGLALVGALAWLPARPQHLAWAGLSVWLLATVYLGHGAKEYGALAAVLLLAVAGTFVSPWFLVALWALHPLWDLVPRDLPAHQHDLPHACLVYDLVVAAYLAWRVRRGDLTAVGGRTVRDV
jgi:hypothetical protein